MVKKAGIRDGVPSTAFVLFCLFAGIFVFLCFKKKKILTFRSILAVSAFVI